MGLKRSRRNSWQDIYFKHLSIEKDIVKLLIRLQNYYNSGNYTLSYKADYKMTMSFLAVLL